MANELSQALPLQIRVLDGPLSTQALMPGLPNGVVHLDGRSGPYRPITYEREMRRKTTYYPGNPEGTQQIIGRQFSPMTITGTWKDRYLGDGVARQLEDLFDSIHDAGSSLEVTWGARISSDSDSEDDQRVRVGILWKFKTSPDRPQDIAWEMTFDWRGTGQAQTPAITSTTPVNPREGFTSAVGDIQFAKQAFGAYQDGVISPLPQSVRDAIGTAFTAIDSATDTIQRANSVIASAANIPGGTLRNLIAASSLAIDAMGQLKDTALSLDPSRLLPATDAAVGFLLLKDQVFTLLGLSEQGAASARQASDGIAAQIVPDIIAEIVAPAGVDLRDLALRYYGDPDSWFAIAQFNDLDSSLVPAMPSGPGDVPPSPIRIPRLQAGAEADVRQNC